MCAATRIQVTFRDNSGAEAGALWVGIGAVTLTGRRSVFQGNRALDPTGSASSLGSGGAININIGTQVTIEGPVCAQNNSGLNASFAFVRGTLELNGLPGSITVDGIDDPSGATIALASLPGSTIRCGSGAQRWANQTGDGTPTNFRIRGDVCVCNTAFVDGSTTTCDSCSATGWDPRSCGCAVSAGDSAGKGGGVDLALREFSVFVSHTVAPPLTMSGGRSLAYRE